MGPEARIPASPFSSLLERAEGLILLTGCRTEPGRGRARASSVADGEASLRRLVHAFGPGSVFVELQDNAVKGDAARNRALRPPGRPHGARASSPRATSTTTAPSGTASRTCSSRSGTAPRSTGPTAPAGRIASSTSAEPWEMRHRFQSRPEALTNTLLIAERCAAFDLTEDLGYEFPDFEGSDAEGPHGRRGPRDAGRRLPGEDRRAVRARERRGAGRRGPPPHGAHARRPARPGGLLPGLPRHHGARGRGGARRPGGRPTGPLGAPSRPGPGLVGLVASSAT